MKYIFVFLAVLVIDWLWAYYIKHTASNNVWRATISSGFIVLFGAVVTTAYVDDKWSILPAVLGGMTGTWLSLRFFKH